MSNVYALLTSFIEPGSCFVAVSAVLLTHLRFHKIISIELSQAPGRYASRQGRATTLI